MEPNHRIDKYNIIRTLGRGSFGKVYNIYSFNLFLVLL